MYGALLYRAGVDVHLVARERTLEQLRSRGAHLRREGRGAGKLTVRVPAHSVEDVPQADVVLLTVRAQALPYYLPIINRMGNPLVVFMMHVAGQREDLVSAVGRDRLVMAFPGLGGFRADDSTVIWAAVPQQPTTIDAHAVRSAEVGELLAQTGLRITFEKQMTDWLSVHSIFVSCLSMAILRAGVDPEVAARDPGLLRSDGDGHPRRVQRIPP